MTTVNLNFNIPVSFDHITTKDASKKIQNKFLETIDSYFYFGNKIAYITSKELNSDKIPTKIEHKNRSFLKTILKIASYLTIVIPVICLSFKIWFRTKYHFTQPKVFSIEEKIIGNVPKNLKNPEALFVFGGSGSGKSTFIDKTDFKNRAVIIDSDLVKQLMPEYQKLIAENDPDAASKVHNQSLMIKNKIFKQSKKERRNLIIDSTGQHFGFNQSIIQRLKQQGYKVTLILIDVNDKIALQRAENRAKSTGRKIPFTTIITSNDLARDNFRQLKLLATDYAVYNNFNDFELTTDKHKDFVSPLKSPINVA